jgi:OFA family oxalate/formate antiporter-like MFS transporter
MKTDKKIMRWPYLLLGAVGMLFAGIIYAWSILKAPLAENFGWSVSALALNFTMTMCFFCIGGLISGVLLGRLSPKLLIALAPVWFWQVSALRRI